MILPDFLLVVLLHELLPDLWMQPCALEAMHEEKEEDHTMYAHCICICTASARSVHVNTRPVCDGEVSCLCY